MELLLSGRFEDSATAYGYVRIIFDQVAGGSRPATFSITPSTRHVGVTRRDTFRPGFRDAVGAAGEMGYPVLVRSSGGGATAADRGTFGFSIIRPADEKESGRGIRERYDEAAALTASLKPGRNVSRRVTPTWRVDGVIETVAGREPPATWLKTVLT